MEQVGLAATNEVTLWALFIEASFVVKLVMVGLVAASIWTWAIIVDKSFNFARAREPRHMRLCFGESGFSSIASNMDRALLTSPDSRSIMPRKCMSY